MYNQSQVKHTVKKVICTSIMSGFLNVLMAHLMQIYLKITLTKQNIAWKYNSFLHQKCQLELSFFKKEKVKHVIMLNEKI